MQGKYFTKHLMWLLIILLSGCQSLNMPEYDANTDRSVTHVQMQVNQLFMSIEQNLPGKRAAEEHYRERYQTILAELQVLYTRQQALPHNKTTAEQVELLIDSIKKLQQRHALGFHSVRELHALQSLINSHFRAILKLELAKKKD